MKFVIDRVNDALDAAGLPRVAIWLSDAIAANPGQRTSAAAIGIRKLEAYYYLDKDLQHRGYLALGERLARIEDHQEQKAKLRKAVHHVAR